MGTDPDCNCLSPALPSATQPSLSAATRAGRDVAPSSTRVPYRRLGGNLAELGSSASSEPPSSMEGSSGAEELPGTGLGDASAPSPTVQQTLGALLDPAASASPKAEDKSIPFHGMLEEGAGTPVLPHQLPSPRGISTAMPAAVPSSGSAQRRAVGRRPTESPERVTQLRFSRMAPLLRGRAEGGPGDGTGARGWGLSRLREPEDGGAGPSFDSSFVLSAEQRRKEPPAAGESHRELLVYVTVASVVAVLLAMGGLLFYKYKSKVSPSPAARRCLGFPSHLSVLRPKFKVGTPERRPVAGKGALFGGSPTSFSRWEPPPHPHPSLLAGPAAAARTEGLRPRGAGDQVGAVLPLGWGIWGPPCAPRPGDPGPTARPVTPRWVLPRRALQGAEGCAELETQEL